MKYVYLHGFASGPGSKKAQYFRRRFLELGIDLVIPDLAGGNFEGLTITGQLGVIQSVVGDGMAVLMGSSLGGYLAALYAARHAEIDRIILLAPGFGFPQRWPATLGEARMAEWKAKGFLTMFHYGENAERRLGYQLMDDSAAYENYPAVAQPCLIYHGRNDTVVPAAYSEEFAAGRPNVELHIEESDHELLNVVDLIWDGTRRFIQSET